ncbi:hypothetical protein [Chelatococcus reniformis]|nr:hypothetical protein [Chelatococcus reniformis]
MTKYALPFAAALLAATTTLASAQAPGGQGTWGGSANSPTSDGTNQGGPLQGSPVIAPDDRTGSVVIIEDDAGRRMQPDGQGIDSNAAGRPGAPRAYPNR